jgi:uncharacterized membrane protein YidH (DUF202 family)
MQEVDEELQELEKLILLQQQKLSLLRRKKQLHHPELDADGDNKHITQNEVEMGRMGEGEVNNAMHHHPGDSDTATKPGKADRATDYSEPEEEKDSVADLSNRGSMSYSSRSRVGKQVKGIVEPINRMSYLSTELANERTLLSWIRTALAMFRTVFSFYNFEGINTFGDVTQRICLVLITLLAGATFWNGFVRYGVVFEKIFALDPLRTPLGRPSIKPYVGALFFVFVAVMVAVIYRGWWVKL